MANSRIVVQNIKDVTVVDFADSSILEAAVIQQIANDIYKLVDNQAKRKLLLDFSRVRFLSSQALGMLLNLRKKVKAIDGDMVLCGLHPELRRIFKVTNLDKIFKFEETEREGLAYFNVFEH
jgi:anti-sigma B factor antagonist